MDKQTKNIIWFIVTLVILFALIWLLLPTQDEGAENNDLDNQDVGIEQTYDNKIVYANTDDPSVVDNYRDDCQARDGQFQECGSPCAPGDDICIQVCAYTCLLETEEQDQNMSDLNWIRYENQDMGFALLFPQEMNTEVTQAGGIEFQLLGPDQQANTEIYDGLRVVVSTFSYDQNIGLESAIEQKIENNILPVGELSQELTLDTEYELATYSYSVQTLGNFQHIIMPVYPGLAFDISYFASDRQYEDIAKEMIKSFEITNEEKMSTKIDDLIEVSSPKLGQTISSPLEIRGMARGLWFFENQFSIVLTDWDGRIIGEAQASSDSDWMTEDFIDFSASLEYELDPEIYSPRATLILQRSNPSGLPENDQALEYPVYLELE